MNSKIYLTITISSILTFVLIAAVGSILTFVLIAAVGIITVVENMYSQGDGANQIKRCNM